MSTNFYWMREGEMLFLGKRSGAGAYCWECRRTLAIGGELGLHKSGTQFSPECPQCGLTLGWWNGEEPHGVQRICSFTWADDPSELIGTLQKEDRATILGGPSAITGPEFLRILRMTCPIQFVELEQFR